MIASYIYFNKQSDILGKLQMLTKYDPAWFFHRNSFNVIISLQVIFILINIDLPTKWNVYVTSNEYSSVISFPCFAKIVNIL